MEKTRKRSMIPEFLKNRKIYVLTAIVVTIIGVLSLSFAYFNAQNANGNLDNTIVVSTLNSGEVITTFDHSDGTIRITNEEFNSGEESITKILKFSVNNTGSTSKEISANWIGLINKTCKYVSNNGCSNDESGEYVGNNFKYYFYSCPLNSYNSATINYDYNSNCEIISNEINNVPNTDYKGRIQAAGSIVINSNTTKYYVLKVEANENNYNKYAIFESSVKITNPSYEINDINIFALTIDGTAVNSMPDNQYYVLTSYSCLIDNINYDEGDSILEYDTLNKKIKIISNITNKVYCSLNFNSSMTLVNKALTDPNVSKSTLPPTLTKAAVTQEYIDANGLSLDNYVVENGIFQTIDDDGTTYFYRGHVERNYVKFAGFIWRIIRINGDGSVRIILDGLTSTVKKDDPANTLCTTGCAGSNAAYNNSNSDTGSGPGGSNRANEIPLALEYASYDNGNLENAINSFYTTYIYNEANNIDYRDYLADSTFCSDTSWTKVLGSSWGFIANPLLILGPSDFTCGTNYQYEVANGTGKLTYPIASLSSVELYYAGTISSNSNKNYYIYNNITTNAEWWIMSPNGWDVNGGVFSHTVNGNGILSTKIVSTILGVRPVLNLKADTMITSGIGTSDQPYQVGQ